MKALFEIEDNEANGCVYYFCSDVCLNNFEANSEATLQRGNSDDAIDGTVCDWCGVTL